jgi:hypothetical protein
MTLEAQSPPRKALLQVSEQSYRPDNEWSPSARAAMRYSLPLVPKTPAQRRLMLKSHARKRKLSQVPSLRADHQPFAPVKPAQPQVKKEVKFNEDTTEVYQARKPMIDFEVKSSPDADPMLHEFVYARDWDTKTNRPVINFPLRKFRVVRRDPGGVLRTLSDIDLPVTFVQPPPGSDEPCVSTCNEYVLLQLRRRNPEKF